MEGSSEASDFISFLFDLEHFPSSEHRLDYIRSPVRGTCSIYITMALEVGTYAAITIMVPGKTTGYNHHNQNCQGSPSVKAQEA